MIMGRRGITIMDDFFLRAILAGIGVALVAGPMGCVVIWRRMAYFGDAMAHSALLGVALAFAFAINLMLGVFLVVLACALGLVLLQRREGLSADAVLGILSHGTLAVGLVIVSFLDWVRIDLMAYLFGDILAVSRFDLMMVWGGGAAVLGALALIWRPLLAGTISPEIAAAEGMRPERARLAYMLLLAAAIAIAMKMVGVLLITALLVIPPATARRVASGPEGMAIWASLLGALAVLGGLFASLEFDTPSGPSIVVASLVIFVASLALAGRRRRPDGGVA